MLVNEARPIRERVDAVIEAPGMGVAKLSAILLVAYPEKYGVWNGTSQKALTSLGLWPEFRRGATTGERYVAVNQVLLDLARKLEIDLWTLDAIWWGVDVDGAALKPANGAGKVRIGDGKAIALANMKYSILNTVQHANGQTAEVTVKNKDLKMLDSALEVLLPACWRSRTSTARSPGCRFSMRATRTCCRQPTGSTAAGTMRKPTFSWSAASSTSGNRPRRTTNSAA